MNSRKNLNGNKGGKSRILLIIMPTFVAYNSLAFLALTLLYRQAQELIEEVDQSVVRCQIVNLKIFTVY